MPFQYCIIINDDLEIDSSDEVLDSFMECFNQANITYKTNHYNFYRSLLRIFNHVIEGNEDIIAKIVLTVYKETDCIDLYINSMKTIIENKLNVMPNLNKFISDKIVNGNEDNIGEFYKQINSSNICDIVNISTVSDISKTLAKDFVKCMIRDIPKDIINNDNMTNGFVDINIKYLNNFITDEQSFESTKIFIDYINTNFNLKFESILETYRNSDIISEDTFKAEPTQLLKIFLTIKNIKLNLGNFNLENRVIEYIQKDDFDTIYTTYFSEKNKIFTKDAINTINDNLISTEITQPILSSSEAIKRFIEKTNIISDYKFDISPSINLSINTIISHSTEEYIEELFDFLLNQKNNYNELILDKKTEFENILENQDLPENFEDKIKNIIS